MAARDRRDLDGLARGREVDRRGRRRPATPPAIANAVATIGARTGAVDRRLAVARADHVAAGVPAVAIDRGAVDPPGRDREAERDPQRRPRRRRRSRRPGRPATAGAGSSSSARACPANAGTRRTTVAPATACSVVRKVDWPGTVATSSTSRGSIRSRISGAGVISRSPIRTLSPGMLRIVELDDHRREPRLSSASARWRASLARLWTLCELRATTSNSSQARLQLALALEAVGEVDGGAERRIELVAVREQRAGLGRTGPSLTSSRPRRKIWPASVARLRAGSAIAVPPTATHDARIASPRIAASIGHRREAASSARPIERRDAD